MNRRRALIASTLFFALMAAAPASAKSVKGAELRTKAAMTYGRFEVRMKSLQRSGALASFFTYNDNYPSTPWNEIDIEIMGRYGHDVQFNPITPGQVNHVCHRYTPFNPAHDFHTYAFEWTPTYVAWFVEGTEVHRQTGAHIQSLTQAQKLMMNVWNPIAPGWAGAFDATTLPAFAYYDWVSYASYTPGAGSTGTGNNFSPQWRDEFNSFDSNRWAKATHTWDGNGCDFVQENVVYQNGWMILCLTDSVHLGYQDVAPPSLVSVRGNGQLVTARFTEELDSVSATTNANYLISGGPSIAGIRLLEDRRAVELTVTGMDPATTYNLFCLGVYDDATPANKSTVQVKPIAKTRLTTFPVRINCGGPAFNGYLADQEWSDAADYGYSDGSASSISASTAISGTTEPEIYRTERFGHVLYRMRVPNGSYRVTVMMAENYFSAPGLRAFTVTVQGLQLVADFDLYATAGKNAAVTRTSEPVSVTDGTLEIHFGGGIDNPLVNGLVIEQTGTGVGGDVGDLPGIFRLFPNYPNPFNGVTNVRFDLPAAEELTFRVFDLLGRTVAERALGNLAAGTHTVQWEPVSTGGAPLSSGAYVYALESPQRQVHGRFVYLR